MFDHVSEEKYFSRLDLKFGFHQIRVSPEDVEKTAFKTKCGHFGSLDMPMGLRNAPATFQTLMNSIFCNDIDELVVIYLEDILVFSNLWEDDIRHLRIVLDKLKGNEMFVGKTTGWDFHHRNGIFGTTGGPEWDRSGWGARKIC